MADQAPPFDALVQGEKLVLVDFMASWCAPCRTMAPILKQAKDELGDRITIIKVDVDKNPHLAQAYQISGVPTLMLFQSGQTKWRQSGVVPLPQLLKTLQTHL